MSFRPIFSLQPDVKHFPNLDGWRFIAAFMVILGHCQQLIVDESKKILGHEIRVYQPFANKLANFGVNFFYVLSGFLISYLLFVEYNKTQTIQIKHFYYRRFLRIWPLYFAVGLLGLTFGKYFVDWVGYFAEVPYTLKDYQNNLFFLCTFSINFQTLLGFQVPVSSLLVGHFWSLGIEEQFYLIWAPAIYFFRKKMWLIITLFVVIGLAFNLIPSDYPLIKPYYHFHYYFTVNRFYHFGIGAALAYFIRYFDKNAFYENLYYLLQTIHVPPSVILALRQPNFRQFVNYMLQIVLSYWVFNYLFGEKYYYDYECVVHGYMSIFIIALAIQHHSVFNFFNLEHSFIKYLGRISFGVYIFHLFSIYVANKLMKIAGVPMFTDTFYILLPLFATLIAIFISVVSYEYFEKYFLRIKHKFK